jgi:hypothetical protein
VAEADDAEREEDADDRQHRVGQLVEAVVVEAARGPRREERGHGVDGLALQEELRVVVLHGRLHRTRAVDHDDAEADERDDDGGEHGVDGTGGGGGLGVERRGELQAYCAADVAEVHAAASFSSARTQRTNSSPRCL